MKNFETTLNNFKSQIAKVANVTNDRILVSIDNNIMEVSIITKNQKFNQDAVILSFGDKVINHEYEVTVNKRSGNTEYYLNIQLAA